MEMKPNALGRSRRGFNHPQFDRVAFTAIELDQSRFVAEHRSLKSVGTVETRVPVVLRRWELIPVFVVGNELFEAVGKFKTSLLDTRGDLSWLNVDCHCGAERKMCGVAGQKEIVCVCILQFYWNISGCCCCWGPVFEIGLSATMYGVCASGMPLVSIGTITELGSFICAPIQKPPSGGCTLQFCT